MVGLAESMATRGTCFSPRHVAQLLRTNLARIVNFIATFRNSSRVSSRELSYALQARVNKALGSREVHRQFTIGVTKSSSPCALNGRYSPKISLLRASVYSTYSIKERSVNKFRGQQFCFYIDQDEVNGRAAITRIRFVAKSTSMNRNWAR